METTKHSERLKKVTTVKGSLEEISRLLATDYFREKAETAIAKGREFEYSIRIKPTNRGTCVVLSFREFAPHKEIMKFINLTQE
jgi:hypothetical protein